MQSDHPTIGIGHYLAQFERLAALESGSVPSWLRQLRKTAIARFAETGFPTRSHEDWKYTDVSPIVRLRFDPVLTGPGARVERADVERFFLNGLQGPRLVFVDGHFCSGLSSLDSSIDGLKAGSIAAAIAAEPAAVEPHLGRYADRLGNAFVALNTSFFQDGAFIYAPPGTVARAPIHLLFIATGQQHGVTVHPRNLIVAQRNSQITVIEHYASLGSGGCFTNAVTELALAEGAVVEHCKIQNENLNGFHVASILAHQDRDSNFVSHSISAGARLARNDIRSVLDAEGCYCALNGLYLANGSQLVDHHTAIDHAKPHCESHEWYHGILDGCAKGVFNGKIHVHKAAQKTDAKQTNRNLLLSDDATIDAKPQLEIFADDVKCTHGATVGQLDEEAIFYLRSRGIGEDNARKILIHAFVSQILDRIKFAPVRAELDRLVLARLGSVSGPGDG